MHLGISIGWSLRWVSKVGVKIATHGLTDVLALWEILFIESEVLFGQVRLSEGSNWLGFVASTISFVCNLSLKHKFSGRSL